MTTYILALDAGGTAVKAAIYDAKGREYAGAGEVMAPQKPAPGHNERDPEAMWAALCRCIAKLMARGRIDPADIAVVGMTGYGNGLFLVDDEGAPVRNAILSSDQRAAGIVARWRDEGREAGHIAIAHQRLWAGKPLPLLAWLDENEPGVLARARHVLMCKDFLRLKLTGKAALEVSDASSGSLLDQAGRVWTPAMLDHLGLSRHRRLFGALIETLSLAGAVSESAAMATGLKPGTPVSAGYADGPAMLLALGIVDGSKLNVVSGTWGLNQLVSNKPSVDGSILASMHGARAGDYVLVDGGATSASTFEWFVEAILAGDKGVAGDLGGDPSAVYDWCNAKVAETKDEDPPVYFLPYLNGRLDLPAARGSFIGLTSWHGLPHMVRAVFEGVALEHRRHVDMLLAGRPAPTAVRFAGGAARSRPWLEIFAAALNLPLELSEANELGALGAAIVASVAAGLHPDLQSAVGAMTRVKERIEPDPRKAAALARRAVGYRILRDAMEPVWSHL